MKLWQVLTLAALIYLLTRTRHQAVPIALSVGNPGLTGAANL